MQEEIEINNNNDVLIKDTLKFFTSKLNSKLQDKNSSEKKNADNSCIKGNEINDISEIFLTEYNTAKFIQYSHLYFLRLKLVKDKLVELAKKKWKNVHICANILEAKGNVI